MYSEYESLPNRWKELFQRRKVEASCDRISAIQCNQMSRQEAEMRFRVILETDEDNVIVAQVPALPGCISQGRTRAEAVRNIREAIEGYLESLREHNEPIPPPSFRLLQLAPAAGQRLSN